MAAFRDQHMNNKHSSNSVDSDWNSFKNAILYRYKKAKKSCNNSNRGARDSKIGKSGRKVAEF